MASMYLTPNSHTPKSVAGSKSLDGLLQTTAGQRLVQAKLESEQAKKARFQNLDDLVYLTFVEKVPEQCTVRTDWIYRKSADRVRYLGKIGGAEYESVLNAVKYAWAYPPESYQQAKKALGIGL